MFFFGGREGNPKKKNERLKSKIHKKNVKWLGRIGWQSWEEKKRAERCSEGFLSHIILVSGLRSIKMMLFPVFVKLWAKSPN